jgi:hypothetical protein
MLETEATMEEPSLLASAEWPDAVEPIYSGDYEILNPDEEGRETDGVLESEALVTLTADEYLSAKIAEDFGGDASVEEYSGTKTVDGNPTLVFDGETLFENGQPVEWGQAMIECWQAGKPYSFDWPESRGGNEYLCFAVGELGEGGLITWTNREIEILEEDEENPSEDENNQSVDVPDTIEAPSFFEEEEQGSIPEAETALMEISDARLVEVEERAVEHEGISVSDIVSIEVPTSPISQEI